MREIKFRAKDRSTGQWVYGYPYKSSMDNWFILTEMSKYHIDERTLGQYTGLISKNNKLIFEGDILNNYDEPNPLTVKWDPHNLRFALYNQDGDLECGFDLIEVRLGIAVDAEVIGNIHEPQKPITQ